MRPIGVSKTFRRRRSRRGAAQRARARRVITSLSFWTKRSERSFISCWAILGIAMSRWPSNEEKSSVTRLPKKLSCVSRVARGLKKNFVRVLVQGGQKRDTLFSDVPTIHELMDKHRTPEPIKRLADVLLSTGDFGRPLIAPPNLPAERLKVLRDGDAKMLGDRDFLAEATKREWEVERISGAELEAMAKRSVTQSAETVERLRKILGS